MSRWKNYTFAYYSQIAANLFKKMCRKGGVWKMWNCWWWQLRKISDNFLQKAPHYSSSRRRDFKRIIRTMHNKIIKFSALFRCQFFSTFSALPLPLCLKAKSGFFSPPFFHHALLSSLEHSTRKMEHQKVLFAVTPLNNSQPPSPPPPPPSAL